MYIYCNKGNFHQSGPIIIYSKKYLFLLSTGYFVVASVHFNPRRLTIPGQYLPSCVCTVCVHTVFVLVGVAMPAGVLEESCQCDEILYKHN